MKASGVPPDTALHQTGPRKSAGSLFGRARGIVILTQVETLDYRTSALLW
jgi:hypothetical protein